MSQRKSPVVQHTLTGPRVPTSRGRGQRPGIKGNLYIANPDTDSDSDEPQKPIALGSTPTPASQFASRGSIGSVSQNQVQQNTATMPGLSAVETLMPQDWARQQQRQQIARGLTVVTQPPTPGVEQPFANDGVAENQHPPIQAQYHFQPTLNHNIPSRNTGIPLSTSSSSMGDPSIAREPHQSLVGASPLSAVSGSGSGTGSAGTGTGISSSASYDEAGRQILPHGQKYLSQQHAIQATQKNANMQNLPRLTTPPTMPQIPSVPVPPVYPPPPPPNTSNLRRHQPIIQSGTSSPPSASGSSGIPPALPPRPSGSQQPAKQASQQHSATPSISSVSSSGKYASAGALATLVNPAVANVASPVSQGNVPSPVYTSSPSSPSFAYPTTARNGKSQQQTGPSSSVPPTHALPAIPSHGSSYSANSKLGYVRLQVTVDNENFSVVDVSGVTSSEAIMERVFSKLRFRDDDHPSLTMFRTDIGETPDLTPVGKDRLFDLCKAEGDAKGGLKFLVVQTAVLPSPSSMAVPPAILHSGAHQTFSHMGSPVDASRRAFSAGSASQQGDKEYMQQYAGGPAYYQQSGHSGNTHQHGGYAPYPNHSHQHGIHHQPPNQYQYQSGYNQLVHRPHGSRHSKEGSVSSASASASEVGVAGLRQTGQAKYDNAVFEASPGDVIPHSNSFGGSTSSSTGTGNSLVRNSGMPTKRRLPGSNTSRGSQSPAEERRGGFLRVREPTPPLDLSGSSTTSSSALLPSTLGSQQQSYFVGSATPTMANFMEGPQKQQSTSSQSRTPRPQPPMHTNSHSASPELILSPEAARIDPRNDVPGALGQIGRSPSDPTEADMAEILRIEQQDADREKERKRRLEEEDRKVAMQEQQKEHAAWEAQQQAEREARSRQIEADRLTAELTVSSGGSSLTALADQAIVTLQVQQERERAQREERETEQLEESRTKQVARERREKRAQWENRSQMLDRMRDTGTDGLATMSPEWLYGEDGSTLRPGIPSIPLDSASPSSRQPLSSSHSTNPAQETLRASRQHPQGSRTPLRPSRPQAISSHGYEDAYEGLAQDGTYGTYQDPFTDYSRHSPENRHRLQHAHTADPVLAGHPMEPVRSCEGIRQHAQSVEPVQGTVPRARHGMTEESIYEDDAISRRRMQYPAHPFAALGSMGHERRQSPSGDQDYSSDSRLSAVQPTQPGRIAFPEPMPSGVRPDRRGSESRLSDNSSPFLGTNPRRKASLADLFDTQRGLPSVGTLAAPTGYANDGASVASGSTVHADQSARLGRLGSDDEDDSGGTARADRWAKEIRNMFGTQQESEENGTLRPAGQAGTADASEEPEETLWFVPPSAGPTEPTDATKPSLRLVTDPPATSDHYPGSAPSTADSEMPPSSNTAESRDSLGQSVRVQRTKSFARTKDQWNERPNPEHVYDHLEEFFPKIDLDRPVLPVVAVVPSMLDPTSPRTESPEPFAQANHITLPNDKPQFNRAENRKSIRLVAQDRKRHLSKIAPAVNAMTTLERKRSSSMWGHKTVEVTPAKLKRGQVPGVTGEAVAPDGRPETMTWVKGDLIGRGTYGRVYLGLNATTGDMMAVKQVELPATDRDRQDKRQAGMIKALRDEIELLKNLEHPHIVQYLGWEESSEYISIFLEYVPGGSIASVYRKHQKFEEAVIKSFTKQILAGLAYLHAKGILHRDLKADNILVDSDGICKITDFGISKQAEDAYASEGGTNLKGSVFWMAPEVIRNMGRGYSAKVDIWSLGCLVLEMFAGRRPWGEDSVLTTMFSVGQHNRRPPVPDDVVLSSTADDFMNEKCLAIEPNERPTAEELKRHPFITEFDPNWTFADSNLGKLVNAATTRRR